MNTIQDVLQPFRSIPLSKNGLFRVVRDEPRTMTKQLYGLRSMKKNTFTISQSLPPINVKDGVTIKYINEETWEPAEVSRTATGGTDPSNPVIIQMDGITKEYQAINEALYNARINLYRRKEASFGTTREGLEHSIGDKVLLQNQMPMDWGIGGDILKVEKVGTASTGRNIRLITSEPLVFDGEPNFMVFRKNDGGITGVFNVYIPTPGERNKDYDDENQCMLQYNSKLTESNDCSEIVVNRSQFGTTATSITFYGLDGKSEKTHFAFYSNNNPPQDFIVRDIQPRSYNETILKCDVEDLRIYAD